MATGELPIESLEAGLNEGDEQELDDDLSILRGETGVEVETEIAREEDARDTRIDLLEGLREMQGADAVRWRLYRVNDDDPRRNGFLDEIATGQLTQKWIRDSFGGGTYRVRGYHVATGKFKAGRTIRIAGDAPKKGTNDVTGQAQASNFNFSEYIAQQDARDMARRKEERALQEEREDRFWKRVTALGTVLAPVLAAVVGKKDDTASLIAALRPKETDPLEMFRLLREMKDLDRPAQPNVNPVEQAITLLERFKDMGALGGGGSETSWFDIAREAVKAMGPTVGQGIQSIMEQAAAAKAFEAARVAALPRPEPVTPGAPGSAAPRLPAPSTSPGTVTGHFRAGSPPSQAAASAGIAASPSTSGLQPVQPGDEEMLKLLPLLPWLKGETERLIIAAARGSDPELRAAAMFDDLPDNADIESIGAVLSRSDWFTLFSAIDSRVAQHEPWFAEVRGTLLSLITEETGVVFGVRSAGGADEKGRPIVNVQGPGASATSALPTQGAGENGAGAHFEPPAPAPAPARKARDPDAPIERPGPPSLTGV